jgi:hypothetical protein
VWILVRLEQITPQHDYCDPHHEQAGVVDDPPSPGRENMALIDRLHARKRALYVDTIAEFDGLLEDGFAPPQSDNPSWIYWHETHRE